MMDPASPDQVWSPVSVDMVSSPIILSPIDDPMDGVYAEISDAVLEEWCNMARSELPSSTVPISPLLLPAGIGRLQIPPSTALIDTAGKGKGKSISEVTLPSDPLSPIHLPTSIISGTLEKGKAVEIDHMTSMSWEPFTSAPHVPDTDGGKLICYITVFL